MWIRSWLTVSERECELVSLRFHDDLVNGELSTPVNDGRIVTEHHLETYNRTRSRNLLVQLGCYKVLALEVLRQRSLLAP